MYLLLIAAIGLQSAALVMLIGANRALREELKHYKNKSICK